MGRNKTAAMHSRSRDTICPSYCFRFALETTEGAGKAGCPPHPWSACNKKHAAEPQVQADHPAFPAQWFYGLYVLSPVTMLGCHRRLRVVSRKLSACIGAPGPHDFTVRLSCARLAPLSRPPHSGPTSVTTRTPLLSGRDAKREPLIWGEDEANYFFAGDWKTQITLNPHAK